MNAERRREVELEAIDLALADIVKAVDPRAAFLAVGILVRKDRDACVHQRDQVADLAIEEIDADDAARKPLLEADIDAPGGFELEVRIADGDVIVFRVVVSRNGTTWSMFGRRTVCAMLARNCGPLPIGTWMCADGLRWNSFDDASSSSSSVMSWRIFCLVFVYSARTPVCSFGRRQA